MIPGSARAMGRWQVHPDRLWDESHRLNVEPRLGESWDEFGGRVVTKLFSLYLPSWSAVYIAMYWHLGHWSTSIQPDYDAAYAVKYENALARLVGALLMWPVAYGVTVEAAFRSAVRTMGVKSKSKSERKRFWRRYELQNRLYLESLGAPLPRGLLKHQPRESE